MRHIPTLSITTAVLLLFSSALFAGPGKLDVTFGENKGWTTSFGLSEPIFPDHSSGVIQQADGKYLTASEVWANDRLESAIALLRFNPDGSPDTTFAETGLVLTPPTLGLAPFFYS